MDVGHVTELLLKLGRLVLGGTFGERTLVWRLEDGSMHGLLSVNVGAEQMIKHGGICDLLELLMLGSVLQYRGLSRMAVRVNMKW